MRMHACVRPVCLNQYFFASSLTTTKIDLLQPSDLWRNTVPSSPRVSKLNACSDSLSSAAVRDQVEGLLQFQPTRLPPPLQFQSLIHLLYSSPASAISCSLLVPLQGRKEIDPLRSTTTRGLVKYMGPSEDDAFLMKLSCAV